MTFVDSSSTRFTIDDATGVEHDISSSLTEISGLPGARQLIDVTSFTDSHPKYIPGTSESTVTLAGIFNDTGADAVLGALLHHTSPVDFAYAPAGTTAGSVRFSGRCWVERYQVASVVDSRVGFTAVLRVDGPIARSTY